MKKGFIEIDENDIRAIERFRDFTLELSTKGYGSFSTKWINQSIDLTNRMYIALKAYDYKCINENYAKGIPKCQLWCEEDYCKQTKERI